MILEKIMKILIFQLYGLLALQAIAQNYDQSKPMVCICSKCEPLLFNDVLRYKLFKF